MLAGILIILVFLVAAGLMMTRRVPALLALPGMAVAIGVIAGIAGGLPWSAEAGQPSLRGLLFDTILTDGSVSLARPMMYTIFGSILSQVVMRQGIAQRIVRVAAEYAGDHKLLLAFLMLAAVALNFSAVTGLGAVIMVGSLVLPILVGSGLSAQYAGSLVLFGIAVGGIFNLANLGFYVELLKLDLPTVRHLALGFGFLLAVTSVLFLVIEGRKESGQFAWAALDEAPPQSVPLPALLTPLLPIVLVGALQDFFAQFGLTLPAFLPKWPIIPAFLAAILYGLVTTAPRRLIGNLTAALLEGLKDVAPVLGLFMGIGMALKAVMDPVTKGFMDPLLAAVLPTSPAGFVLFFTLMAPLALYRGPLNLWGLGAGFAALMAASGALPAAAVMAAFITVGQVQSVCDPTNTHNVWIAQFVHGSTERFLRSTLPYLWVYVLVSLIYAVTVLGVMR